MSATQFSPPPTTRRVGEVRAIREPFRLFFRARDLLGRSANDPVAVMLVPGLGASDRSGTPLRAYLSRLGHETFPWDLGSHGPDLRETLPRFERRLTDVVAEVGGPLALVGWSLGGIVARETARDRPDLVSTVITYGSPLRGPRYTAAAGVYSAAELDLIDGFIVERGRRPITVPVTAIYSKNDGVVDWRTCVDSTSPQVENIEVTSTHLGMGLDPDVWAIVADRLALAGGSDNSPQTG